MAQNGARTPPPRTGKRRTSQEMEIITCKVEDLLLQRLGPYAISTRLKMPLRTVADYTARVHARWKAETAAQSEILRGQAVRRLARLGRAAERKGKLREAIQAEGQIAKIQGLEVTRHELTGKDGAPLAMPVSDAVAELRRALELETSAAAPSTDVLPATAPEAEPATNTDERHAIE